MGKMFTGFAVAMVSSCFSTCITSLSTSCVELPAPAGEVEIPAEGLVEDGRQSVVFVRSTSDPSLLIRHRVKVARRFRDVVYLTAEPGGVRPGNEVVTSGALLLNEAMNELPIPRQ